MLYYSGELPHKIFFEMSIDDIRKYFERGGKSECITQEIQDFFEDTTIGRIRIKHVFSVYILGIYCYDHIESIKKAFNSFVEKTIWPNTGETHDNVFEEKTFRLRRDFLYLWYLTALYHDMGYLYENRGNNDNSCFSNIVNRKNIFAKESLGNQGSILGIPQKLHFSSNSFFWNRRNNIWFNEHLCLDHGFAGGMLLFNSLKQIHYSHSDDSASPTTQEGLAFGPKIFQWYNIPSAWAIICHNIWMAFKGTAKEAKYKELELNDLVIPFECSLINYKNHPLLFLLDFIDTIDPFKRFCLNTCLSVETNEDNLNQIEVNSTNNSLSLSFESFCTRGARCPLYCKCIKDIDSSLDYLKSHSFHVQLDGNTISFKLGKQE